MSEKERLTFYNLDGEEIQKELKTIEWDAEAAEKAGFEHFMMKEIYRTAKSSGRYTEFRAEKWKD